MPQRQLIAERFDSTPHSCIMDVAGGPGGRRLREDPVQLCGGVTGWRNAPKDLLMLLARKR